MPSLTLISLALGCNTIKCWLTFATPGLLVESKTITSSPVDGAPGISTLLYKTPAYNACTNCGPCTDLSILNTPCASLLTLASVCMTPCPGCTSETMVFAAGLPVVPLITVPSTAAKTEAQTSNRKRLFMTPWPSHTRRRILTAAEMWRRNADKSCRRASVSAEARRALPAESHRSPPGPSPARAANRALSFGNPHPKAYPPEIQTEDRAGFRKSEPCVPPGGPSARLAAFREHPAAG